MKINILMGKSLINGQCSTAMLKLPEGNHQHDIRLLVDIANININRCRYYHRFHLLNIHHSTIILSYLSYYHIYIDGTIISIIDPHYNHSPFHFALDGRVEPKRPRRPRWSSPWTASSRRMTTSSRPRTTCETDVTAGGEWQWMADFIGFKML